jgi:hypothetical protein
MCNVQDNSVLNITMSTKIYLKEIHLHLTKNTTLSEQNQNRRRGETRYPQTRKYLIAQFPCLIQTL